jgi:hypothetical protein
MASTAIDNRAADPRTIRAPAATITGAPRDFRVVTIRLPDEAPRDRDLDFESESAEDTPLLGKTSGIIRAGEDRAEAVRLTIGIPARARAGSSQIALVRFTTREPSGTSPLVIEVPVQLLVQPRYRLELNLLQPAVSARPGQTVAIPIRLYNAGNLPDEVALLVDAPAGWRTELLGGDAPYALPVHAMLDRTLRVRVPLLANGGSWTVRIVAMRGGDVAAEKLLTVAVINGAMAGTQDGARVTIGTTAAGGPWHGIASALSVGLDGQLTDDLLVSGRAVHTLGLPYGSQVGLGRNGYSPGPPSLALLSSRWRVNAGAQAIGFSELTGVNGAVLGVSGGVTSRGWSTLALAGRSVNGASAGDGVLTGVQAARAVGTARVGLSLTHLDEHRGGETSLRSLDAAGASAVLRLRHHIVSQNEIALRRSASGTGLGISSHLSQQTEHASFELSLLHAPGGSAAFARASSELAGSLTRDMGRVHSSIGAWKTSDHGVPVSGVDTRGGSIGSAMAITRSTTFTMEARRQGFGTNSSPIRFGTDDKSFTTGLGWGSRATRLWGSTTWGTTMRTTGIAGGLVIEERAPRSQVQAGAAFTTSRGVLQFGASNERHGAGTGLPSFRRQYGVQLDRVTVFDAGGARVLVSADFQRMRFGATRHSVDVLRAGVHVEVPSGLHVVFDVERNPFYAASFVKSNSTMWSVHVGQPIELPRFGSRAGRGVAYRDLNGNGRREASEPALGGLAVRRGSETTVTDERGGFRFSTAQDGTPSLEARSLPLGFVAGAVSRKARNQYDLAVTSLAPVRVELFVTGPDSSRVPRASLSAAVLVARDSAGMSWVARAVEGGSLLFDGLPPGRYTLSLDLADIAEPLKPDVDLPMLTVTSGVPGTQIRIGLRTRAIRIRKPASSSMP